jgi:hypothetical protein
MCLLIDLSLMDQLHQFHHILVHANRVERKGDFSFSQKVKMFKLSRKFLFTEKCSPKSSQKVPKKFY